MRSAANWTTRKGVTRRLSFSGRPQGTIFVASSAGLNRGAQSMPDDKQFCEVCQSYHGPPIPCDHDPTKPCLVCGGVRGFRALDDGGKLLGDGRTCCGCAIGMPHLSTNSGVRP